MNGLAWRYSVCAITSEEVSGRYNMSSTWVFIKDNIIGWVRVCGWVVESKRKNWGRGIDGFIGYVKGFRLCSKDSILVPKEYWLRTLTGHGVIRDTKPSEGHFHLAVCLVEIHVIYIQLFLPARSHLEKSTG